MLRLDKKEETCAVEKKQQPKQVKYQVAAADNKKLPTQWVKAGSDCINLMAGFLSNDNKAVASLAQTCRFLYHQTNASLEVRKLKKLAHHVVVEPSEAKVTAMLKCEPTLVNAVIKEVTDPSGQKLINNTLFQLAYGAGDPEMCLALKPFFIHVYGSEEAGIQEMERQRLEKFAEDKKEDARLDKEAKDNLAALLTPVIIAITAEQFNHGRDANGRLILSPATLAAIETFRAEFDKSQPKRIEKGMHFRTNTLLETCDAYVQAAAQWNYNYNKCALFEDGVLSCVLFYAPANDAQRFSQGLYYLQDKNEDFRRMQMARDGGKNNFYIALRRHSLDFSLSGSSFDIVFGCAATTREGAAGSWGVTARWGGHVLQNLCRTKTSCLQSLRDLPRIARSPSA
jgi:hypothetical protein